MGYCHTRAKAHEWAIGWYDQAVAAGFQSAALYNDRGVSYVQIKRLPRGAEGLRRGVADRSELATGAFQPHRTLSPRPSLRPSAAGARVHSGRRETGADGRARVAGVVYQCGPVIRGCRQGEWPRRPFRPRRTGSPLHPESDRLRYEPRTVGRDPIISVALKADSDFKAALATPPESAGPVNAPRLVNPAPYLPE